MERHKEGGLEMNTADLVQDGKLYYGPLTSEEVLAVVYCDFSEGKQLEPERAKDIISQNPARLPGLGVVGVYVATVDGVKVDCRLQDDDKKRKYIFVNHYKDWEMVVKCIEKAKEMKMAGYEVAKSWMTVWFQMIAKLKRGVVMGLLCALCGTVFSSSVAIDGATWYYRVDSDGVVITNLVSQYAKGDATLTISIPDKIDNVDVVEIAEEACSLPDWIFELGEFSTAKNEQICPTFIKLPAKVKRIGAKAFWNRFYVYSIGFGRIPFDMPKWDGPYACYSEFPRTLEKLDKTAFGYYEKEQRAYDVVTIIRPSLDNGTSHRIVFWGDAPLFSNDLKMELPNWAGGGIYGYNGSGVGFSVYPEYYENFYNQSDMSYEGRKLIGGAGIGKMTGMLRFEMNQATGSALGVLTMSCSTTTAKIYYTIDGSDPTEESLTYTEPIAIPKRTVVKAIAVSDQYNYDTAGYQGVYVETYEYGDGYVVAPAISGNAVFDHSHNSVTIDCSTEDAVIRYTIDGSAVTENSPIYTGPFTISETTTVRAKAFKKEWFDSEEAVQTFTRVWHANETPVISAASTVFDGVLQEVSISCATEGATVYYTIDGNEPSAANGRVYKGPFSIYDSVTVKAIAVKDDWKDSAVANAAFTKNNGLSAAINLYDYLPDNDANCLWTVDTEVSHDGVSSVRSGKIGDGGATVMKVSVKGIGKLSFWWKAECENACDGEYYDYGVFRIGSEDSPALAYIAGHSEWQRFETEIGTTGKHVLRWEYRKDDADSAPPDCIWVDQVQWVPADDSGHTLTTETPVPYSWLERYGFGVDTDFETAAKMKLGKVDGSGRAMSVEDDYVAGTDPTNLESKLTATIKMDADGKPIVSWKPPLNGEDASGAGIREGVRSYSVYGKQTLDDTAKKWWPVAEGGEENYRFFKVKVVMPEQK